MVETQHHRMKPMKLLCRVKYCTHPHPFCCCCPKFHFYGKGGLQGSENQLHWVISILSVVFFFFTMRPLLYVICVMLLSGWAEAVQSYTYDGGIELLFVGQMRVNETISFPRGIETEVRRRYLLHGLSKNEHYTFLLSHLGSPSIEYKLRVIHLPRSVVEKELQPAPGQRKLADTVLFNVRTRVDEPLFEHISSNGDDTVAVNFASEKDSDDELVPIMEVCGRRSGFPIKPEMWLIFFYNIHFDVTSHVNGLKFMAINAAIIISMACGVFFFVPWLLCLLVGDAPKS